MRKLPALLLFFLALVPAAYADTLHLSVPVGVGRYATIRTVAARPAPAPQGTIESPCAVGLLPFIPLRITDNTNGNTRENGCVTQAGVLKLQGSVAGGCTQPFTAGALLYADTTTTCKSSAFIYVATGNGRCYANAGQPCLYQTTAGNSGGFSAQGVLFGIPDGSSGSLSTQLFLTSPNAAPYFGLTGVFCTSSTGGSCEIGALGTTSGTLQVDFSTSDKCDIYSGAANGLVCFDAAGNVQSQLDTTGKLTLGHSAGGSAILGADNGNFSFAGSTPYNGNIEIGSEFGGGINGLFLYTSAGFPGGLTAGLYSNGSSGNIQAFDTATGLVGFVRPSGTGVNDPSNNAQATMELTGGGVPIIFLDTPTDQQITLQDIAGKLDVGAVAVQTGTASPTDLAGTLASVAGAFTYSFVSTFADPPTCIVQDQTTIASLLTVSVSNTALSGTTAGMTDAVAFHCTGTI